MCIICLIALLSVSYRSLIASLSSFCHGNIGSSSSNRHGNVGTINQWGTPLVPYLSLTYRSLIGLLSVSYRSLVACYHVIVFHSCPAQAILHCWKACFGSKTAAGAGARNAPAGIGAETAEQRIVQTAAARVLQQRCLPEKAAAALICMGKHFLPLATIRTAANISLLECGIHKNMRKFSKYI